MGNQNRGRGLGRPFSIGHTFGVKHGHSPRNSAKRNRSYNSWAQMKDRCRNPRNVAYHRYGGRGITVCERWDSFENFLADMGERPKGLTLDRLDNDGNYEPENCAWRTRAQQAANTCAVTLVKVDGELVPMREAARRVGLSASCLRWRMKRWPASEWLRRVPLAYARVTAERAHKRKVIGVDRSEAGAHRAANE